MNQSALRHGTHRFHLKKLIKLRIEAKVGYMSEASILSKIKSSYLL